MTTETKTKSNNRITTYRLTPFYGISQLEGTATANCLFSAIPQFLQDNRNIINKAAEFHTVKAEKENDIYNITLITSDGVFITDIEGKAISQAMNNASITAADICIPSNGKELIAAWSTDQVHFREFAAILSKN